MSKAEDVVNAMIDACNRKDIEGALACFHEDVVYHNIPMEPVTGREGVRKTLGPFLDMAQQVDWITHKSVSNGVDLVKNERNDRQLMPHGWCDLPVMGVFEVRDGKIAAWRDYFDSAAVQALLGGGS